MLARNLLKKDSQRSYMLHKCKERKVKDKFKKITICSEILHTQIPYHVATSELNRNKSQINGFHKAGDTRAGNLTSHVSNKSQLNLIKTIFK